MNVTATVNLNIHYDYETSIFAHSCELLPSDCVITLSEKAKRRHSMLGSRQIGAVGPGSGRSGPGAQFA